MGFEIERKFLVDPTLIDCVILAKYLITQHYIAIGDNEVRVRITNNDKAVMTFKSMDSGIKRKEYNMPISMRHANKIIEQFGQDYMITKLRSQIRYGGNLWEIDEFMGDNDGLYLAEVELDECDEVLDIPWWAGLEVTHDINYRNSELVKHPFKKWGIK
jgi:adenylate cyclase